MAWPPATHQDVQDAVTARAVIADVGTVGTPTGDALRASYVAHGDLFLNVKDYGATGNGTTDDTAAVQSALTAAQAARRPLYFPAGSYKVTAPLGAINVRATPLVGDGPQSSRIVASGIAQGSWLMSVGWDGASGVDPHGPVVALRGLTLVGGTASTACNGVQLQNAGANPQANRLHFVDVGWYGFGTQVGIGNQSYIDSFHRCRFDAPVARAVSMDQPTNTGENVSFISCAFADGTGDALVYSDMTGSDLFFYACSFDYSPRALWQRSGRVSMLACHFETNSAGVATATEYLKVDRRGSVALPMLSLVDCTFSNTWDSYATTIRITGDSGSSAVRLTNPYIGTSATMTAYFIRDDGPTPSDILIMGHWVSDDRYTPQVRTLDGTSYRLSLGAEFNNRPKRTVRRLGNTAIEPFPVTEARGTDNVDNGTLWVTMFSPTETVTLTGLSFWTGSSAHAGATLLRVGLYSWDTSQATLKASSASDTTLAAATFTRYTKSFTTPYTVAAGEVIGLAILLVGATTLPQLASAGNANDWLLRDATYGHPLAWRVTGQTDLPSVVYNGSQFASGKPFYLVGVGS